MNKSIVAVLVLCVLAVVLVAVHQMTCDQKAETTTACDVGFMVPVVVLTAVACGVCGLAVISAGDNSN